MLSQTSINVNWEIQKASMFFIPKMSSQICCTNVWMDRHFNLLELVQWGFLCWGTQKNLSPSSFNYRQWSMEFWVISKVECCGALFLLLYVYLQAVNSHVFWEIMQLSNIDIKPCFWKMYCHSTNSTMTTNSYY